MTKPILMCATLMFAILLKTTNAAPVVIGITPETEGVTTDLFDVAQGTIVTSSSAQYPGSDARSTFGYLAAPSQFYTEPSRTIFADFPAIATDFINFQTVQPINLGSYELILAMDSSNRGADAFRLYASSNSGDVQSHLVSSATFSGTYVPTYGSNFIEVSDSLNLSGVQFFRMEIDRATLSGASGPRVVELDGFAPVPEPSSLVLAAMGLVGLARAMPRVRIGRTRST